MSCPAPNSGCAGIRKNYTSLESFIKYRKDNLDITNVANYIRTDAAKDAADGDTSEQRYQDNLSDLQTFEARASQITRCLQQEVLSRQCEASKIYTLQQETQALREELKEKRQIVMDAKERARLLEDPYSKTTVHALWFPLGRPLKKESVPVLLSVSILFLILSLGMFLRLMNIGFELNFSGITMAKNAIVGRLEGIRN